MISRLAALGVSLGAALLLASPVRSAPDTTRWTGWGNGLRFDRFSAADQINTANVGQLHPVWKYVLRQKGAWEVTPIVVDGMLYAQDIEGNAFALDPETGREAWRFSAGVQGKMRAVSYWPGDGAHKPRIIMAVKDRIYALDAATGKPVAGFGGAGGYIDIREGFATPEQPYGLSSPPTIYKNLLIAGPSTQEFGSKGPPGDPRAYDAVTGKLVWRFHTVPRPGERNFGGWGPEGWKDRAGPGSWGMMSVDEETGMVFVPTANPADNYIGIDRPGDNLYADSVIALDAATGEYRWHFQMIHHDLFDYDVASPPALVDLTVKGKPVKALVEVTKQGLMFILDRRTGKPVFGVEERPVPPSTVPGERASPTQPFPLKPVPLAKMGVTRADLSTITPEVHRYCTDQWNRMGFRDTPAFTPPSLTGPNLFMPSNLGGAGGVWGGVSIDPRTGTIFVNVTNLATYNYIVPDDGKSPLAVSGYRVEKGFRKFLDQNGMPCIQPPWGEMIAVNGNTGDIAWRRPLGAAEIYREMGAHTGLINLGGSLATAGGLVFIGATNMGFNSAQFDEPVLRAFDSRNGLELWRARLAAGIDSAPMSFTGKSGRQYVVVASSTRPDADIALVAFALPRPGEKPVDLNPAPLAPSKLAGTFAPAAAPAIMTVEALPMGSGRDDVAKVCTACHGISTVTGTRQAPGAWAATVGEMRSRGAKADDAAAKRIVEYLGAHFGTP